MKIRFLFLAGLVLAACQSLPTEQKPKLYTMTQFMDIVQINGGSFSSDETKLLISSKETGIFNACEIDVNTADDRKHGDVDLKDCVESKKLLATLPYIDMDKVGIMVEAMAGI